MTLVNLENDELVVAINPRVGGTITSIRHKSSGLSVLGWVPWEAVDEPLTASEVTTEAIWLTRYNGGWPLLFPNGGDARRFDGRFHGFHGEASISPWQVEQQGVVLLLERHFEVIPAHMRRKISLEGQTVVVSETVILHGAQPAEVMWGQHPTFGSDLLSSDFEIATSAGSVLADKTYDPPSNPLMPGSRSRWPMADGKSGPYDLRRPGQGGPPEAMAALAFLSDFDEAWISIRRLDGAIAAELSWDPAIFPYAWMWFELNGTMDAPWAGRTRLIGLEPNTTRSANGLADARECGERLLQLQPGKPVTAETRLKVFSALASVSK